MPQTKQLPEVRSASLSAEEVREQVNLIQKVMMDVMKDGTHYGVVPGCGDKKVLLKPGAEKLALTFRFSTMIEVDRHDLSGQHREYDVRVHVRHSDTHVHLSTGVGSCSTMESKYRYRQGEMKCPNCNVPAVIRGKKDYGGGFLCWGKKGGCGSKWSDESPEANTFRLSMGKAENPDIADTYNTVLKMAKKRAMVDAILSATAASDIFTQDLEEEQPVFEEPPPPREDDIGEPLFLDLLDKIEFSQRESDLKGMLPSLMKLPNCQRKNELRSAYGAKLVELQS